MVAVLEAGGLDFDALAWDDPEVDWGGYDAALIGSTWDYCERREEFLEALERIEERAPLFNPARLVRWNSRKTYLRDLEGRGVSVIPTLWRDGLGPSGLEDAHRRLGPDLVVKLQVGASAVGQLRVTRGEAPSLPQAPVMVQPFLPAIQREGELSFVFIEERLSHALVKRPRAGDYRIQASYGGREEFINPDPSDRAAAESVLDALGERPLYSRVDMVRGEEGRLLLMELELVEPFLYPGQGPGVGALLSRALARRLR